MKPSCPYCGKSILKDAEFDDNDGTMEMFSICKSCGIMISVQKLEEY